MAEMACWWLRMMPSGLGAFAFASPIVYRTSERRPSTGSCVALPVLKIMRSKSVDLHDTIRMQDESVEVTSLGRWSVGLVVDVLTKGQTPTLANPIKIEAILACEELELPTPDIRIDDISA